MIPILFIWPSSEYTEMNNFLPLGLGYLASNLAHICDVSIWDGVLENSNIKSIINKINKDRPEIVGISTWNFNLPEVSEIVSQIKNTFPEILVVIGGPAISCYQDSILTKIKADYAFAGEGDVTLPEFIKLYMNNRLCDDELENIPGLIYKNKFSDIVVNKTVWPNLDQVHYCNYKIINIEKYWSDGYFYGIHKPQSERIAPIQVTRGCPYPCEFCSARRINGVKVRVRPVESVIGEIIELHSVFNADGINIIDDNFTYDLPYAKKICREIIKLNLRDFSLCCPNGVKMERLDSELLNLMKQAGWSCIYIAPESGSPRTLKNMRKHVNLDHVAKSIALIKNSGLLVLGYFIIGYPGETIKDIMKTIRFATRHDFDFAVFTCFQPIPGTPVYDTLYNNGEIGLPVDGADYCKVVYAPESLSVYGMKIIRLMAMIIFYTSSYNRFINVFKHFTSNRILAFFKKLL